MIEASNLHRWKRFFVPISLGVFVIGVVVFCIVYIQEKRQQNELAVQIGQLSAIVSQPAQTDEELLARFEEIEQLIPVISNNPLEGQFTRLQFIEQVNTALIDRLSDPELYPDIDCGAAGNFKITYNNESAKQIGKSNYKIMAFKIRITGLGHERLLSFIQDIGSLESLPTLVVTSLEIYPEGGQASFDLDFDIYCRTN